MREKVQEDVKAAMKSKDQLLLNTLRGLLSEIKKTEIDSKVQVEGDQFISIIQKEVKKRRDAIDFAKKAERQELVEQNETEIKILQRYLGDQLSEQELEQVIEKLISGGATQLGSIMGGLTKDYKGRFDGKVASEIAKRKLG
jgi:uncharacterized protein